jgi:predicted FMN-binding regulatory protein PaiB
MKLYQLAKLVRSKNAGPFVITIDILFETKEIYDKVVATGVLSKELISELYQVPIEDVEMYLSPNAYAIKFSYPRTYPTGDFYDTDIYGCQHHAPLVELEIPVS